MSAYSLQVTVYLSIVCILNSIISTNGIPRKPCGDNLEFIADLDDCNVYYVCVAGSITTLNCTKGFSFAANSNTCVPKGSIYDSCTPSLCQGRSGLIPHPDSCAMFYDCDSPFQIDVTWEPRLRECRYPDLFNTQTKRCEPFRRVKCGTRTEPKSQCGYYANQCRRAHCIPCHVRYPSCEGLKNGVHPWKGREWSPFYVGCRQERVLFQKECPREGGVQVFDPIQKKCVTANNNFV